MQFEYDPEQLIAEVAKRPVIWNNEHPGYRAKHIKSKLWHEIVTELVSLNNVTMTKSEMRELEIQLQKKWKSLRDCFQKYMVNSSKFKRPYLYSKQLQFLLKDKKLPDPRDKVIKTAVSSESDDGDTIKDSKKNVWVRSKKLKTHKMEEESDDDNQMPDDTNEMNITESDARNISEGHGQFAYVDVAEKSDSDKMFLMSLLPHMRSIPEEFKLNVKLELMQVLRVANESTAKLKYLPSCLD